MYCWNIIGFLVDLVIAAGIILVVVGVCLKS